MMREVVVKRNARILPAHLEPALDALERRQGLDTIGDRHAGVMRGGNRRHGVGDVMRAALRPRSIDRRAVGARYFETSAVGCRQPCAPVQCGRLSLIHISEPTRRTPISYAVF